MSPVAPCCAMHGLGQHPRRLGVLLERDQHGGEQRFRELRPCAAGALRMALRVRCVGRHPVVRPVIASARKAVAAALRPLPTMPGGVSAPVVKGALLRFFVSCTHCAERPFIAASSAAAPNHAAGRPQHADDLAQDFVPRERTLGERTDG